MVRVNDLGESEIINNLIRNNVVRVNDFGESTIMNNLTRKQVVRVNDFGESAIMILASTFSLGKRWSELTPLVNLQL